MEEIWKDIKGYDGKYQISNLGRIKITTNNKKRKEKILKQLINKDGYYIVRLTKNKIRKEYFVHRLVAIYFIDYENNYKFLNDEKNIFFNLQQLTVNHIDKNRLNNIFTNLEWCTLRYNIKYSCTTERKKTMHKIKKLKQYLLKSNIDEKTKAEILEILNF